MKRENDIQAEVIAALRKMGKFVLRLNSGKARVKGGFIQLCPTGTPDIQVIEHIDTKTISLSYSRVTWLEIKRPREKQTPEQVEFEMTALQRGERYFICYSLSDALEIWN